MEIVAYITCAIAFSLILFYIGIVRAERYYYKNEYENIKGYLEENGYPIGYNINGVKVVCDKEMNCNGCFFHKNTDSSCNKSKKYGPCYSSARSDKQSIKFIYEEKGNQA